LASSADGLKLVAAFHDTGPGQVYTSTNGGVTWQLANAPMAWWWSVAISADGGTMMAAPWGDKVYMAKTAFRPTLSMAPSIAGVALSWVVPSRTLALQQNDQLTAAGWTDVPATPVLNYTNLHYEVGLPKPAGTVFYRLAWR
jgi:hypothetical protein